MSRAFDPVDIARQFAFVREAGANRGLRVEAIQHWSSGQFGDSWCAEFLTMVLDICYQGDSPIPREQACQDVLNLAQRNGWVVDDPQAGDIVLSVNDAGHAHHIALCTLADPLTAIAGNTSEDGTSSNGTGVFEHAIAAAGKVFVRLPAP